MKKFLIVLCCLALMMPAALASGGDANIAANSYERFGDTVDGGCVLGDTLYLKGSQNLFVWKQGDEDVTLYPYDNIGNSADGSHSSVSCIFSNGDKLYALIWVSDIESDAHHIEIREMTLEDGKAKFSEGITIQNSDNSAVTSLYNMARYEENGWQISASQIEWYRSRASWIYVSRYNYLNSWSDDGITTMVSRLVDGEITLDTFLSELDHASRMMALEGN